MTGQELKMKRKMMKKTQAEFALWLGVSQEMVSMMEEGKKAIPADIAGRLAGVTGEPEGGMFQ